MFREIFLRKKKDTDHSLKLIYEMFYPHVYKTAFFITKDHLLLKTLYRKPSLYSVDGYLLEDEILQVAESLE